MPPGRLAAPLVSMVFTEPPPPEPSLMRLIGSRKSCAISSAISGFAEIEASAEPPRTVKSSPTTTTVRPSILPRPNTQFAGVRLVSSPLWSYSATPEIAPISWKVFGSTSLSIRSRTVSRPWSRCRLTLSTPPISRANASRRARSSSSGFQFIRILRLDDLVFMGRYRERLPLQPVAEELSVGALEQAADRRGQFPHPRRDFPMQPFLVKHRGEKSDRDHDECLILRRPQRHRETVDMRAPQAAGNDVTVFAQEAAVGLDTGPQHFGALGNLAFHFRKQRVADIFIKRRGVGMARSGARHGDAAAGAFMQTERVGRTGKLEIDQMKAIRNDEAHGSRQMLGDILQPQPDQVAQLQPAHHRGAHRHRARTDAIFLVARQIDELAHPGQRVGQARHRRSRQTAAIGNFQVAEPRLMAFEAAQYIERARHHLDDVSLTCKIAGEHSLFAEPLRASSHVVPRPNSAMRNKIPLADQATSGNLRPQAEGAPPFHLRVCRYLRVFRSPYARRLPPENGMPDIKIVTEVAGRVCALPVEIGGSVGDGDDIVFVEAMKMEIPVAAPAAGKLKSILVSLDDVVAEGQVLAILET